MQDRPSAAELLESIAELLEGPLIEATEGGLRHQVRVAANLSRILQREFELGQEQERRALSLLADALEDADPVGDVAAGNAALYRRLKNGDEALEARAWPALLEIVRGKLAIAKPGHDDYDFDSEMP